MLWYPDEKLVVITPPHTASGNLTRAVPRQHGNAVVVLGPGPDGNHDHHYATVGSAFEPGTRVACVWRDPEARLLGLWAHHAWHGEQSGLWTPLDWPVYVRRVAANSPRMSWFYKWTIAGLLEFCQTKVDVWLRFDRLAQDYETFTGWPIKLPERNTPARDPVDYWTDDQRQLLAEWLKRDRSSLHNGEARPTK